MILFLQRSPGARRPSERGSRCRPRCRTSAPPVPREFTPGRHSAAHDAHDGGSLLDAKQEGVPRAAERRRIPASRPSPATERTATEVSSLLTNSSRAAKTTSSSIDVEGKLQSMRGRAARPRRSPGTRRAGFVRRSSAVKRDLHARRPSRQALPETAPRRRPVASLSSRIPTRPAEAQGATAVHADLLPARRGRGLRARGGRLRSHKDRPGRFSGAQRLPVESKRTAATGFSTKRHG